MTKILSLSKFQAKKNKLPENDNTILFGKIPFYGIAGSICYIEEAPECYYKIHYNQDGTINPQKLPVAKKKTKNFELLKNDYCKDLANCLENMKPLYREYENNSYKPKLSNKQFIILFITTLLATIISLPFLFTTTWIGLIFSTISTLSLYIVCDIHKKDNTTNKKRTEYINQFKQLQQTLNDYQSNSYKLKEKTPKTKYPKIKVLDKSHQQTSTKVRILNNHELMKAA